MSSSRLPGKMMMDIHGKPVIARVVERLRKARRIDDVVLATTVGSTDDVLAEWAHAAGVACHRGSEDDVLQRVVDAQRMMSSDIVVEVCGDTPLTDPGVLDTAISRYLEGNCDVVSNTSRLSFPQGIDAQVFALEHLAHVAETIDDPAVREHVSLYFYEHPEIYRIVHLDAPAAWRRPDQRLQLDYPEDLDLIREIYTRLAPAHGDDFGLDQIIGLLDTEPAVAAINASCTEKPVR